MSEMIEQAAIARGQIISNFPKPACTCHGGPAHYHEVQAIWDGEKWVTLQSAEGFAVVNSLGGVVRWPEDKDAFRTNRAISA
jgi:hypothetical protein